MNKSTENEIDVSIVIVCMNNLTNLYPCLNSIVKHTRNVNYETFVVAFLFSDANLVRLRNDYPWVKIVQSKEFRGFSENNNLALRLATGKYCFVVNDDTYWNMPVIDLLCKSLKSMPENVAVLSPVTLNVDNSVQRCGKPKYNLFTYILGLLKLIKLYEKCSKYTNGKGIFRTYNISGACFLIRYDIFSKIGFFDEKYYFCPEDIALSTQLNNNGYLCYVDTHVKINHIAGGTWSKNIMATKPAQVKGEYLFYTNKSRLKKIVFILFSAIVYSLYSLFWAVKYTKTKDANNKFRCNAYINAVKVLFDRRMPKDIFIDYYNKVNR